MTDTTPGQGLVPLVSQVEIGDIAIKVDADNGYLARTGDTLVIGMMVAAMWLLQQRYEAERASLTERIRELWAMLERRQRCEECGGSGAVAGWINDEHGGDSTIEPCACWGDAERVIEKYRKEYGDE